MQEYNLAEMDGKASLNRLITLKKQQLSKSPVQTIIFLHL